MAVDPKYSQSAMEVCSTFSMTRFLSRRWCLISPPPCGLKWGGGDEALKYFRAGWVEVRVKTWGVGVGLEIPVRNLLNSYYAGLWWLPLL